MIEFSHCSFCAAVIANILWMCKHEAVRGLIGGDLVLKGLNNVILQRLSFDSSLDS